MVDQAFGSDATLPELLALRAHAASPRRLVADVAGGAAVATAVLLWRPIGWIALAGAALCFATFGGWGLVDRALRARHILDRGATVVALRAARRILAVLGTLAAVAMVLGVLALAMGRFIS
jgi:hypothetical protein